MKHKCIKTAVLITGITAITMFSGCSSCSRSLKSLSSDIDGGLNRTVTVYDYNGGKIKSWSGKFDVGKCHRSGSCGACRDNLYFL